MSTLGVWRFDSPDGAENAVRTVEELRRQKLITVHDAATVSRQQGRRSRRPASSRTWPAGARSAARPGDALRPAVPGAAPRRSRGRRRGRADRPARRRRHRRHVIKRAGADVESVRLLYPADERFEHFSADARVVLSEPLSALPGFWHEVPAGSAVVVEKGGVDQVPFTPRAPG